MVKKSISRKNENLFGKEEKNYLYNIFEENETIQNLTNFERIC